MSERSRSRCLPLPFEEKGAELLGRRFSGWSDMLGEWWLGESSDGQLADGDI